MSDTERWTIDAISEDVARVEIEGERTISVPRVLLPAAARDGLVLAVTRRTDGRDRVTITIEIDRAATTEALRDSTQQVAELKAASTKKDAGGDVAL